MNPVWSLFQRLTDSNSLCLRTDAKQAFTRIVNDRSIDKATNASELLARYCDFLLKKNPKSALSEDELDSKLNQVVRIPPE
jgi:hypothetical protein